MGGLEVGMVLTALKTVCETVICYNFSSFSDTYEIFNYFFYGPS
jgi:hypothetical protein